MTTNIGRIRLKNIDELRLEKNDVDISTNSIYIVDEIQTPKKTKRPGKARPATTAKKKINVNNETKNLSTIVSQSAIKKTGRKEPLPGQLRIDSFFKTATKSYMAEGFPKTHSLQKPQNQTLRRSPRKGCKRLFDENTIRTEADKTKSSTSDIEINKFRTNRTPQSKIEKVKCSTSPTAIIDLCSDNDSECESSGTSAKPPVLSPIQNCQPVTLPMVAIPGIGTENNFESCTNTKEGTAKVRKRKCCPPYKVVEDTTFVVDGFQFGDIPYATHYFLTHYHADHYVGLTRKFAHPLYMTPITANLVQTFIRIDNKYIHEIDVNKSIIINDIEITAIDANHCPGAIMLHFRFPNGKCILHTGDFRASFEMESLPIFWNHLDLDVLYLDTTYLSQNYDFCHQSDSIYRLCSAVQEFHDNNTSKRILHVCGSYLIGKEKVWLALVEQFGLRVWTEPHRRKAIECLNWPELQMSLCDDPMQANLHIINMGKISYPQLDQYFKQFEDHFDMLLGIRPSGWEKNSKPAIGKRISVIGVEYSEHSSYKELERFVRFLKPKKVISTVPLGRDLCITAKVPLNWYNYEGLGRMLSTSYQPSITTFLNTPLHKRAVSKNTTVNMKISPTEIEDGASLECKVDCDESVNVVLPDAVHPNISRFSSDASCDLLSLI